MSSVWYLGRGTKILTPANWATDGVPGVTATNTWSWGNGWSIPTSEFTEQQIAHLQDDNDFRTGAPDGPRDTPPTGLPPGPESDYRQSAFAYFLAVKALYEAWLEGGGGGPGGGSVDWDDIDEKPSTFPPSTHSHTQAQVTGLEAALSAITAAIGTKATPADISAAISALIGAAPAELDTWIELVAEIQENESALAGINTALSGKETKFMRGTVATAMATAAKTVNLDAPWSATTPAAGDFLLLTMTNGNSTANSTLAVNGGTAKPIKTPSGISIAESLWMQAGARQLFIYDGTNYQMVGANTFYNEISDVNITNATGLVLGLISGRRAEALMANEASKARILLGKTIDGDSNTLVDISIGSLKATGTRDSTTVLYGDGTWKVISTGGAVEPLVFNTGTGLWPSRPVVSYPVFWIGGDAPEDLPPALAANDVWIPSTGDNIDLGSVLEALQLITGTANTIPYFPSLNVAGSLNLRTAMPSAPVDTDVLTAAAAKAYIDKLPVLTYTADRTLDASNIGKVNEHNNTTNATFTLNSGIMSEGDVMEFRTANSGVLTIAGTGIVSKGNKFKLSGQWTTASLHCRAAGSYVLTGDLTA